MSLYIHKLSVDQFSCLTTQGADDIFMVRARADEQAYRLPELEFEALLTSSTIDVDLSYQNLLRLIIGARLY